MAAIRLRDAVDHHLIDEIVADESACSYHRLGLLPERGACRHLGAKQVTGRYRRDPGHLGDHAGLCALTAARRAKH